MAISEGAISQLAITQSLAPSSATPLALTGNTRAGAGSTGTIALATSTLSLMANTRAGGAATPNLSHSLPLFGTTLAGTAGKGQITGIGKLAVSKLVGYAVATPLQTKVSASKLVGYAVATPPQTKVSASKLVGYAVATPLQGFLSASKLVGYAVLYQLVPPPPVFPTLPIGFPISATPTFANVVGSIPSGRDMRAPQQSFPVWEFEADFEILRDQTQNQSPNPGTTGYTEFIQLAQTFVASQGQAGQFLFDAWWDDSRTAQLIGTGDGSTGTFDVIRTWGFGASAFNEAVGWVNQNQTVNVYLNGGSPISDTEYAINGNQITFVNAPGAGVTITMDFYFYYLCQFAVDDLAFSEYLKDRWTTKVKFRSIIQG